MRTTKSIIFVFAILALGLISCRFGSVNLGRERVVGSGDLASEERSAENIERISLRGSGQVIVIQGAEEGVTVEADDNLLPYIETEMEGRELVLKIRDGVSVNTRNEIQYTVRVKNVSQVSISGSGDVTAGTLETDDLTLEISGSGNINVDTLAVDSLTVRISGSGNLNLGGTTREQDVTISGSGNYDAAELTSQRAAITINGAGDMTVWAEEELDIRITGSGTVRYYGSPTITQRITGGGTVQSLDD